MGSYISEQHPLVRADADGADGAKKGPFTNEFKKLVTSTLEKWRVPGVAISVVDGDNTWAEARIPV